MKTKKSGQGPDFAYPKTVVKNADQHLRDALRSGDETAALRAMIDMEIASVMIDSENIDSMLETIRKNVDSFKTQQSRSLGYLLMADILQSVYQSNSYSFDNREIPLHPYPSKLNLWSGEQFKSRIYEYVDSALSNEKVLFSSPLSSYSSIVTVRDEDAVYYPSLYDFIALKSIDLLKTGSNFYSILSFSRLCDINLFISTPVFSSASPQADRILSIYATLLKHYADTPAPFINYDIRRIGFTRENVFSFDEDLTEEKALALYMDLYDRTSGSEYSGDVLLILASDAYNPAWLYEKVSDNLRRFPAYYANSKLKTVLKNLGCKSVRLTTPDFVYPGETLKVKVELQNATTAAIKIYSVNQSDFFKSGRWINAKNLALRTPLKTINVTLGEVPAIPFKRETVAELNFSEPGFYAIVTQIPGMTPDNNHIEVIRCSRLALNKQTLNNVVALVVDPYTGKPVDDASIIYFPDNKTGNLSKKLGATDADGLFMIPKDTDGRYLYAQKPGDILSNSMWVYNSRERHSGMLDVAANIITDLSIYHPGDTVKWSGVVYSYSRHGRNTVHGLPLYASLLDANNQLVDSTTCESDDWGRVEGSFKIPADGLTGNFRIRLEHHGSENIDFGYSQTTIMVSDYKLPTFKIEAETPEVGAPKSGDITLRGSVTTYSGVPLAGTDVTILLSVGIDLWFYRTHDVKFLSRTLTTDENGNFEFILTKDVIDASPCPNGHFTAKFTATSPSGESHETSTDFYNGNEFTITSNIDTNIDISANKGEISLPISVLDGKGMTTKNKELRLTAYSLSDSTAVWSTSFNTSDPVTDMKSIQSGTYRLVITPVGFEADSVENEIVVYRPSDRLSPSNKILWAPESVMHFSGHSVEAIYATQPETTWILTTVWTSDRIISRKWSETHAGMHRFEMNVPDSIDEFSVNMIAFSHMKHEELNIRFIRESSIENLKISTETFRDKVVPGSEETWRIKVNIDNASTGSSGTEAAVIMNMYNQALDQLKPYSMNFNLFGKNNRYLDNSLVSFGRSTSFSSEAVRSLGFIISEPDWLLWGQSFYNAWRLNRFYGSRSMKSSISVDYDSEEMVMADGIMAVNEMKVMAEAAPLELNESVTVATEEAPDGGGTITETVPDSQKFTYREGEATTAFFRPMLTTDKDGNLEFSFIVPDANTTWVWNALAYTPSLLYTTKKAEILASKPIMVSPNLPRFVRVGDKAVMKALVMNASDSVRNVTTAIEIFNPADASIVMTHTVSHKLNPSESATADITLDASFGPLVGYRVKSTSDNFTDGEQQLIPVLPSTNPLIESRTFYMVPDSSEFVMDLPEYPDDARVTLQFCENPLWYVVTALPGLSEREMSTPQDAARAIFSAAIADNLLRNNPQIAQAIRMWSESDRSENMLTSMLERNNDLKMFLLNATPWLSNAKNDTERMTSLSLLFKKSNIEGTYDNSIKLLKKLQTSDGGWKWIGQASESSEWATSSALSLFGHLYRLGWMPESKELKNIVTEAVKYIDGKTVKSFMKYPDSDYLYYSFLRCDFKDIPKSSSVEKIISTTVTRTISDWKKMSLFNKGISAILLTENAHGAVAKTIMESVDQFAKTSPEKGMWWPSLADSWFMAYNDLGVTALLLEAYEATGASQSKIDSIRQWLILQKEARDWGVEAPTSTVIADILGSSPRWINMAEGASVKIGDKDVEQNDVERFTGSFRADISGLDPSGSRLTISKSGDSPAWGSVIAQFKANMADVKSEGCDDLHIEKNMYRAVTTPAGIVWEHIDTLTVGDRVKVELVMEFGRTMNYVAVTDNRPACFEPVDQLPAPIWQDGVCFYRENRDASTNIFISYVPKGVYRLSYEMFVNNAGEFSSGVASIQSQYAPQFAAHSSGTRLTVE